MTIDPDHFAQHMEHHWTNRLGNASSQALIANWRQIGQAFNDCIAAVSSAELQMWRILQPPTGSGKSQCLALYCAMLAEFNPQTGVIAIVRLIAQADELVEQINALAGARVARAKHSESLLSADHVAETQILVVTHEALRRALFDDTRGSPRGRLQALTEWRHGLRRLRVIDEALDVVEHGRIELNELSYVIGAIPHEIKLRYPEGIAVLQGLRDSLEQFDDASRWQEQADGGRVIPHAMVDAAAQARLTALRVELQGLDWRELRHLGRAEGPKVGARVIATLEDAELMVADWAYLAKSGKRPTLNAARSIIPEGHPGFVVLDATASQNLLWELLGEKARPYLVPSKARSYRNVTLHVARCSGIGKGAMIDRKDGRIPRLAEEMSRRLTPDRKLLVVAHKDVEKDMGGYDYGAQASFAHWGAIDGLNTYRDHDAVVIFGLHYLPHEWATNTFFALNGPQCDGWLTDAASRRWKDYDDIRRELISKKVAATVVQAINRVRCRRVIDTQGNCEPTDVFLVAPSGAQGDALIEAIKTEMPGIQVANWRFDLDEPRKCSSGMPRSQHLESVVVYLEKCERGSYAPPTLQRLLGIRRQSWDKLKRHFLEPRSELLERLHAAGVEILQSVTPGGKMKLQFVKA